jgi:predicted PurR-regulated permease PerM
VDLGGRLMKIERQVLFWLAALILAALAVLALRDVLLPFVAGMVIAYALNPVTRRLVGIGLSRTLASALVVALLVVLILAALVLLVPVLISQSQQLAQSLPGELERLHGMIEAVARERLGSRFPEFKSGLDRATADLAGNWATFAGTLARSLWAQGLAIVNLVSFVLITPLVVFYLLVDWQPMLARIDNWLPRDHAPTIRRLAGEIDASIGAFIRGQGLVCLILGALYALGLSWAGVRYGLLIGLATGIMSFVPFAGWALGLAISATMALVQGWPELTMLYKAAGVMGLGMALDSALLSPRIVGSRIGLHPVWLIFALFVFSYLFGFVGVLVAVPVAAAIAVLVRFAVRVYLGSGVYRGRGGDGQTSSHVHGSGE